MRNKQIDKNMKRYMRQQIEKQKQLRETGIDESIDQNRTIYINLTPEKIWQYVNPFNVSVYDLQGNLLDPERLEAMNAKAKKQEEMKTKLLCQKNKVKGQRSTENNKAELKYKQG